MNYKDSKVYKHLGDMKHDFAYKVTKKFGEIARNSDMTDEEKLSVLTRDLLTEVHSLFFERKFQGISTKSYYGIRIRNKV
ncbi:hypothetical protein [Bacillus haynesii]|uniref:hypothetical protein n=1 Tax=Bacillus haynesii TaxID=1925021 RepID=UPI0022811554|nr:hypothetical protein [Bacillus haynesii]MCY9263996.1 hypothetical protein [Bacillus haynesii]MEC1531472.1 hypothetical protein [Bacillus haynesii]